MTSRITSVLFLSLEFMPVGPTPSLSNHTELTSSLLHRVLEKFAHNACVFVSSLMVSLRFNNPSTFNHRMLSFFTQ